MYMYILSVYQEVGMLSATASLGLVLLWDVEGGLTQIDKYLYSNDETIKVGICTYTCTYVRMYIYV